MDAGRRWADRKPAEDILSGFFAVDLVDADYALCWLRRRWLPISPFTEYETIVSTIGVPRRFGTARVRPEGNVLFVKPVK